MVSTTPMTTLGEPLFCICRDCDEDSTPSGRIYRIDNLQIISLALSMGMTFSHLGSKAWFQSIPKFRRSPIKIS